MTCGSGGDRPTVRQIQPLDADSVVGSGAGGRVVVYSKSGCQRMQLRFNGIPLMVVATGRRIDDKVIVQDQSFNYYSWDGASENVQEKILESPANLANHMRVTSGGQMFLSTKAGLVRVTNTGTTLALDAKKLQDQSLVSGLMIRSVAENRRGEGVLAIAFPQDWVGVWEWSENHNLQLLKESQGQIARQLAISDSGEILATYNSNHAWLRQKGQWSRISPLPAPLQSPNHLFFDSRNRLWVAAPTGIYLLNSSTTQWSKLQFPMPNFNNHVVALHASRDQKLYAGTNDGLLVISPDGAVQHIASVESTRLGVVTGIVEDENGAIWCSSGASFRGLWRLHNNRWRHFGPKEGLPDTNFHRVQIDSNSRLWALSTGGGRAFIPHGAFRLNGETFEPWRKAGGTDDLMAYSVDSTSDGGIWVGSLTGIIYQKGNTSRNWNLSNGLKSNSVFFIKARPDGGAYFLDRANGVGEIDSSGFVRYTALAKSSAAKAAWELREDSARRKWVATRGGLFFESQGEWTTIGPSAGLENPELWPLAFWRNHACTGTDGSGIFCLNLEALNRPPPRVELRVSAMQGSDAAIAWQVTGYGEPSGKEGNLVRYRVDGGQWTDWEASSAALLKTLSAGTHSFELEARDHLGVRSVIQKAENIVIASPLYEQPIFILPVGISLGAAFAAIYAFISKTYQHNRVLAEKEESFRALIEYSSVGITLSDRNRRIFYVSPAVSIILGYEPHELLGDFRADLVHPDDLAATEKRMSGLLETPGQTQRSRIRMKHKHGQYRWIEMISRNLFENASVGAIVTNLRDITDSTNAELIAAEARRRAENANQAKSDFLAMISHEIRTPMNGITGMCQLLLESNLNREQLDYAETIGQSAQSLLALINDVLDFSRIEAGKLTIERAPIDLAAIMNEVVQLMSVRANEKGLQVEVDYPSDAPRAFYGDALRIRQILFNLTGNAVKFTHSGSVRIRALIEYEAGSSYAISIIVQDTGIGIATENLDSVFNKFTQADLSTTRRYGGSGLGLSISRSLAELMGGTIDVSSVLDQGSEFRLHLNLDAAPENSLQQRHSTVDALRPLPESLEILLVEDNKVNQKLAIRLLEKLGCHARVASSGVQALEMLERYSFDLILMDCQMPEMDGYEATQRIRERENPQHRIPIVAITANAMESDLERCLTSGMDSYLTKPIDFAKLRDALEIWGIDYRAPRATSDPSAS